MRLATARDMDAIMAIVKGTVYLMTAEGSDQWSDDYPLPEHFLPDIDAGTLFIHEESGRMAGFICINDIQPAEYAALTWQSDAPSLVIHRLAVAPDARKKGIGGLLMAFAEELAGSAGIHNLRSDTYSLNKGMNYLFSRSGYHKVGEVNLKGRPLKYNCYEKKLG